MSAEIEEWLEAEGPLTEERALLARGAEDCALILASMSQQMMAVQKNPKELYRIGLNTTRLLMCLGDLVCAWLMLRAGEIAHAALENPELSDADRDYYAGKVAAAKWFARNQLPRLTSERKMAEAVNLDVMELPESAF